MLPPFIIEQIRQREERERARQQPHLELPLDNPFSRPPRAPDNGGERGVIIIDLMNDDADAL